jgi:hypothetical protein
VYARAVTMVTVKQTLRLECCHDPSALYTGEAGKNLSWTRTHARNNKIKRVLSGLSLQEGLFFLVYFLSTMPRLGKHRVRWTVIHKCADKSLAFPIFIFAAKPKECFLGWVKEVRTTKSCVCVCGAQGGICRVNTFFFQSRSLLFSL